MSRIEPDATPNAGPARDLGATLVVVTWNVHGSARPPLATVAERLVGFEPDVVGLQEVQSWQARRLARQLGWNRRWARKHQPFGPFVWWRAEGLAVLSPHELADHDRIVLNRGSSPFSYRRRIAQHVVVSPGGAGFRAVNTHLASHHAPDERAAQAAVVAGWIAARHLDRRPTVLTGDLNADREPTTLAPLAAIGLHDVWPDRLPGATNPAGRARQRLDYVLADPGWEVVDVRVPPDGPDWAALSDHLPVVARLRLRSPGAVIPPA